MLLANASHELRTPLTRINMALAMSETDPRQRAASRPTSTSSTS
jgi:signal transduction histidine kinase